MSNFIELMKTPSMHVFMLIIYQLVVHFFPSMHCVLT